MVKVLVPDSLRTTEGVASLLHPAIGALHMGHRGLFEAERSNHDETGE